MAYHTTVPTTRPALIPPYEEVTLGRQVTAETRKRAIVLPYYEEVTPGRQVNTEIKEGEPAYDYPVIAVNREVQVVPPDDHQYEQPM